LQRYLLADVQGSRSGRVDFADQGKSCPLQRSCCKAPAGYLLMQTLHCLVTLPAHALQVDGSTVESATALIRAAYGPLTAAECVLLGSDVAALTCGVEHELLIQPAQWEDGEHRNLFRNRV